MLGTIALTLAAFMIPATPMSEISPEAYTGQRASTAYVRQADVQTGTILTPHGTEVDVTYPSNLLDQDKNLEYYTHYFDGQETYSGPFTNLSGRQVYLNKGYYNNLSGQQVTLRDKGIARVGDPTTIFNCLSFAFYMYWHENWYEGNNYEAIACWIRNADNFITDKSFYTLDTSVAEPQVNDVVCYFSNEGVVNAGIIKEVYASEASNPSSNETFVKKLSKYKVQSMWGAFGLYEHRGDVCPFVPKYASEEVTEAPAVKTVYYRRHEKHKYTKKYTKKDENFHYSYCECGERIAERHSLLRGSNRSMYCQYCYYIVPSSPIIKPTIPITAEFDYNDIDYKKIFKD